MPKVNIQTPDWLRHMEAILGELNEGVVIVDDQLRIAFANEALLRLGMYSREEICDRTPDAIFPAKDIPYLVQQHESGQRSGRSRSEFYLPRKNGEKIPAIFSARYIQGPDGRKYVLLIVTDISTQKRVEEQLRQSNLLLEERQTEIEDELSLAARVQQSLAPQSLAWNDVSVESYYSPARTIGGDFGVVFPQGDDALTVLVCDVSGHGIGLCSRGCSGSGQQVRRKSPQAVSSTGRHQRSASRGKRARPAPADYKCAGGDQIRRQDVIRQHPQRYQCASSRCRRRNAPGFGASWPRSFGGLSPRSCADPRWGSSIPRSATGRPRDRWAGPGSACAR